MSETHQWTQDRYGNWQCPVCKTIGACCDADELERKRREAEAAARVKRERLDAEREAREEQVRRTIGRAAQWRRVDEAAARGDRRAEVAKRDAAMFGTDPSWFGF